MDETDELALVWSLRTEMTPTPDTVARHRDELRAAIDRSGRAEDVVTLPDRPDRPDRPERVVVDLSRTAPGRSRRGRTVAAVAAATVVLAAGGLIAARAGEHDRDNGPSTGTTTGPPPEMKLWPCGPELPFDMPVPPGYDGPIAEPGPDGAEAPVDGQLTLHWIGATGSIEARWPALDAVSRSPVGRETTGTRRVDLTTPSGRSAQELGVTGAALGSGACSSVHIRVADDDPSVAERLTNDLEIALFAPGVVPGTGPFPLVTGSRPVDATPPVTTCPTPPGIETPDNRGGAIQPAEFWPSAEEALIEFLVTDPTLPPADYVELTLPDGSIAYGNPRLEDVSTYVAVIHVLHTAEGWAVDGWEASGC